MRDAHKELKVCGVVFVCETRNPSLIAPKDANDRMEAPGERVGWEDAIDSQAYMSLVWVWVAVVAVCAAGRG